MSVFVTPQFVELLRLLRVILLEAIGEIVVDAGVFLLQRNGQREDFLFGERIKGAHRLSGFLLQAT